MSVFIVPDAHLNYLINYASQNDLRTYLNDEWVKVNGNEDLLMNVLARANEESYITRYNEELEAVELTWRPLMRKFNPVQVIKACSCFDYQASEVEDYRNTGAGRLIKTIRQHAIGSLPGYEEAAWDITDEKAVA
jgi:hypothetical protein